MSCRLTALGVALELNSSKTFNMAGWRVGMVLGNAKAIDAILKVKSNMDSGMFFRRSNCCAEQ
jgi:aspartate/methionine/tyrosine aminotransferase